MPLSLQPQEVTEALFVWDVIEQPHIHLPCRTIAGSFTKYRIDTGVYSRAGRKDKTQKLLEVLSEIGVGA